MDITTINGASQACCGLGVVTIQTERGDFAKVNILVVPLGYDLLIGIDAIRALGGVKIMTAGDVLLDREKGSYAAISIEEPDFWITLDHKEKAWTATWITEN